MACDDAKTEFPTAEGVEEAFKQLNGEEGTGDEPRSNKPKAMISATTALKRLKDWSEPAQIKRVIQVLSGKTKTSKACIEIIQSLTKEEIVQLVKDLQPLVK